MFEAIDAYGHQVVEFVRDHQAWAAPIMFGLAFGESLAFLSLLLPAWVALVGMGTLIAQGGLNFCPIWVAGSGGGALGDWLSFWIWGKLRFRVPHVSGLSRYSYLLPKCEAFLRDLLGGQILFPGFYCP